MRGYAGLTIVLVPLLSIGACADHAGAPQATAPTASYAAYPAYGQPPPPGYAPQSYPPGYATAAPQYPAPPGAYPAPQAPPPAPTYAPTYAPPAAPPPAAPLPAPSPAPAPAPAPAPSPAPAGSMATPGLLALPCQTDATCGLHRCNTQYGKCAFPCQSAADCAPASQCVMGVCVPGGGS